MKKVSRFQQMEDHLFRKIDNLADIKGGGGNNAVVVEENTITDTRCADCDDTSVCQDYYEDCNYTD